jgi:tetratricopeptide (TPR) repeat protein
MLFANRLACFVVVLLTALAVSCNQKGAKGTAGTPGKGVTKVAKGSSAEDSYPIPLFARPYQDIHESARQAWFLVETSYFVVSDKYKKARNDTRQSVADEINSNIFGINDKVEQLFKDAITQEPENALNHATYAMYLMPRKRRVGETYEYLNAEDEALAEMDKAIALWPDDAGLYMLKIHLMVEARQTHDWMRAGYAEQEGMSTQREEIERLFTKAEQYYPQNAYINYYRALVLYHISDPAKIEENKAAMMREIRSGNQKSENLFYFPPPLPAWTYNSKVVILWGTETEPAWYDHWNQYGTYPVERVGGMVGALAETMEWPKDKQDISDLMYFLYGVGRTQPYDRSYFNWQQRLLDRWVSQAAKGSDDSLKLAEAARFLTDQYKAVGDHFYNLKLLKNPTQINVAGVEQLEMGASRQPNLEAELQPREAAYLFKFGEIFGIDFPLPQDKRNW